MQCAQALKQREALKSMKRHMGGASCPCAGHWPPSNMGSGWIHRAFAGSLDRSAASVAAALVERLLLFAGWPESIQQPVHHWHSLTSNLRAV
jgi:hypothetical protein